MMAVEVEAFADFNVKQSLAMLLNERSTRYKQVSMNTSPQQSNMLNENK